VKKIAGIVLFTVGFSVALIAGNGQGQNGNSQGNNGNGHGNFGDAPEINPSLCAGALTLLGGAVFVIRGGRRN
jgi:hypothetical protein